MIPDQLKGRWLAFRQTDIDPHLPVFWREGSRRLPVQQEDGRWHRKGRGYAQYLSLSENGAWAEYIRAAHVGPRR